jgi:hypothetical protein
MALENDFGILIHKEAIIGTAIMLVSFQGTQPIQCLSATIHLNFNVSHVFAIALAVQKSSFKSGLCKKALAA